MADDHVTAEPAQASTPTETAVPPQADGIVPPATPPPPTAEAAAPPSPRTQTPEAAKDVYREVAETVVFVVVLVLLLKTFVAEAFVIPTGSMATTLWGYQKYVTCPNCGFAFPVNCSSESDPQTEGHREVTRCECPNCRYEIKLSKEHTGRIVSVGANQITIDPPWSDEYRRTKVATLGIATDPAASVFLDGTKTKLDALQRGMAVRVIIRLGDREVTDLEASTEGNVTPIEHAVDAAAHSGDRVLVFKALYDTGIRSPHRHDVVVFKFPVEPQKNQTAMNYIKRLIGLPGETIAIAQGQLYVNAGPRDLPKPEKYWDSPYSGYHWPDDPGALELWNQHKFEIIRKAPGVILAMRRIVFDNDFQPSNKSLYPTRWTADAGWKGEGELPHSFALAEPSSTVQWLRYRNILRGGGAKPELITDFMGYNSGDSMNSSNGADWVGDLILDCDVQVDKADPNGELRVELVRGVDRFQARFNLTTGDCSLFRIAENGAEPPLTDAQGQPATKSTPLKGPGKYHVRLANVDERLTLWVNDALPFGDGVNYPAPSEPGPRKHDLQPASIGVQGAVASLSHMQLWRDTYYTPGVNGNAPDDSLPSDARDDPAKWGKLRTLTPRFFYVQPGHYLCFGDNSPASSDGRSWGMVPERLMLGRALVVYFPFYCPYPPINSPTNRVGPIR